jgi:hypothetical protein
MITQFEEALAKASTDGVSSPEARAKALERVAKTMAGKRKGGFPRLGRQPLSDRTSAVLTLVGLAFGELTVDERDEKDARAVERLTGSDRGRRFRPDGVSPWNEGRAIDGLGAFARHGLVGNLLGVWRGASNDDLEQARTLARAFLDGAVLFSRMTDATFGRVNTSGMKGVTFVVDDPSVGVFMPAMVLSMTAEIGGAERMTEVIDALSGAVNPTHDAIKDFLAQTGDERQRREASIDALPFHQRLQARRLLDEFR